MRRTAVSASCALAAATALAAAGLASAQMAPAALPGTGAAEDQIVVGSDLVTVTVDPAGADATEITGTLTNNTESDFSCRQPGGNLTTPAGTVTDAALVRRSENFLAGNVVPQPNTLGLDTASLGAMLGTGSLGSLGLGDPAAAELAEIGDAQNRARLAGHYGEVRPGFLVPAGSDREWTATLTVPSGERTDFVAGAMFTCQRTDATGQWFAFTGFEEPADDDDNGNGGGSLPGGSLGMGSLPLGSLGS